MKYLHGHSRTRELLEQWAEGSELTVADFFFFNLGTTEQKSEDGLLRGLLFQIPNQHRHLIESAMPKTWQEAIATEDDEREITKLSIQEMRASLLGLVNGDLRTTKLFLLIDGLD
jgi:hypothetical protein